MLLGLLLRLDSKLTRASVAVGCGVGLEVSRVFLAVAATDIAVDDGRREIVEEEDAAPEAVEEDGGYPCWC